MQSLDQPECWALLIPATGAIIEPHVGIASLAFPRYVSISVRKYGVRLHLHPHSPHSSDCIIIAIRLHHPWLNVPQYNI
jgi:hypothetical protein